MKDRKNKAGSDSPHSNGLSPVQPDGRLRSLLYSSGFQSLVVSLLCILLGLFLGYIILLAINPAGEWGAITTIVKNFL